MTNTLNDKLAQKQLAIEGKPLGPGSHTEHEGKTLTGAQAIIASLEARSTIASSCTMCWLATSRAPRTWPMAMRAPRGKWALCW